MKVQNYWRLLFTTVLAILCVGFVSCSSDDESKDGDDMPSEENVVDNLSEEARPFVGLWDNSIFFFSDSSCLIYTDNSWKYGIWVYDSTTKILSTTIADHQWSVTISSENAWSGIHLANNKPVSHKRTTNEQTIAYALLKGEWEYIETGGVVPFSYRNIIYLNNSYSQWASITNAFLCGNNGGMYLWLGGKNTGGNGFFLTEGSDSFSFNCTIFNYVNSSRSYAESRGTGIMTIENPYNLSALRIKFSIDCFGEKLEGVLKRHIAE